MASDYMLTVMKDPQSQTYNMVVNVGRECQILDDKRTPSSRQPAQEGQPLWISFAYPTCGPVPARTNRFLLSRRFQLRVLSLLPVTLLKLTTI